MRDIRETLAAPIPGPALALAAIGGPGYTGRVTAVQISRGKSLKIVRAARADGWPSPHSPAQRVFSCSGCGCLARAIGPISKRAAETIRRTGEGQPGGLRTDISPKRRIGLLPLAPGRIAVQIRLHCHVRGLQTVSSCLPRGNAIAATETDKHTTKIRTGSARPTIPIRKKPR